MYGKHFESMYEGSMYGAGLGVFAVWGYVIARAQNSRVELNPKKLADTLGGTEKEVADAISFLMNPDPDSRHKEYEGRRLIKEGQFQYFIPAWEHYRAIRNEIERREYNRKAKQKSRAKKQGPDGRERNYEQAHGDGDDEECDRIADPDYMHDAAHVEQSPPTPPPGPVNYGIPATLRG